MNNIILLKSAFEISEVFLNKPERLRFMETARKKLTLLIAEGKGVPACLREPIHHANENLHDEKAL